MLTWSESRSRMARHHMRAPREAKIRSAPATARLHAHAEDRELRLARQDAEDAALLTHHAVRVGHAAAALAADAGLAVVVVGIAVAAPARAGAAVVDVAHEVLAAVGAAAGLALGAGGAAGAQAVPVLAALAAVAGVPAHAA